MERKSKEKPSNAWTERKINFAQLHHQNLATHALRSKLPWGCVLIYVGGMGNFFFFFFGGLGF